MQDINLILSILSWVVGSIVGIFLYRKNITDYVDNEGQYFIQTKTGCYVVIHAQPMGDLIPIEEENKE